jgi:hypothetical protein
MESAAKAKVATAADPKQMSEKEICLIDLGRQDRSRIRKLRHGGGKLMKQVLSSTQALKDEGVLAEDSQIVVVLVRESASLASLLDGLREDDEDYDDDED